MPRFCLRNKLIIAFLIVLLPMLALIIYDYTLDNNQWSEQVVDDQMRTGQAIAALADASIDDAFSVAWSYSHDPVLRTMDPGLIDPYLKKQVTFFPQLDDIAIFDSRGNSVGSMVLNAPSGAPRPNVADRAYFGRVTSTGQPFLDRIVISRASGNPVAVAAVPVFGDSKEVIGVTIVAMNLEYMAQRVGTVGLRDSQAIFMTDPQGTVAFHTGLGREEWGRRSLEDYGPVRTALSGVSARERGVETPFGDVRIVAATRTTKYGWVVGVSVPKDRVLQPIQADLARQLVLFSGVLAFAGLVAVLLSRRLILRPLGVLMSHLKAFGRGQLERRAELRTGDEMELLADTFNHMAAQLQEWHLERERLLEETRQAHQEAVEAQRELEQARQRREEFMSMVGHDLRNPLAVIVGYTEMVAQAVREGRHPDVRIADKIMGQVSRLRRLVEDISTVSLIEAGRFHVLPTTCDIRKTVQDIVEQQQMVATKHTVNLAAPPGTVMGNWDGDRLAQALNNLIGNAIKYSPDGGEVRVTLAANNGHVTVSVSDEGIGIAPEDLPQLFQRFSRVCEGEPIRGTGLGLYIARAIVEAHGGRFWVESVKDLGSTFSFAIPTNGSSPQEAAARKILSYAP